MKKIVFLLVCILLLTACQKDELPISTDGLYFGITYSAKKSVLYLNNGKVEERFYPKYSLFLVEGESITAINDIVRILDFHIYGDNLTVRVGDPGTIQSDGSITPNWEVVRAEKVPFGLGYNQGETGLALYNGLLFSGEYLYSIREGSVSRYSLSTGKVLETNSKLVEGNLVFSFERQEYKLSFKEFSPLGNVFTLNGVTAYTVAK